MLPVLLHDMLYREVLYSEVTPKQYPANMPRWAPTGLQLGYLLGPSWGPSVFVRCSHVGPNWASLAQLKPS